MSTLKEQIIENLDSLPERMQAETLDFVEFLKAKVERSRPSAVVTSEPNGVPIVKILNKMAARRALSHIKDPSAWQRDIRKDRPLPGRDARCR